MKLQIRVQRLAKDYSGYKYYAAKGLVLWLRTFISLDDAFQATYILESVMENFKEFPEVVSQAQDTLSNIINRTSKNKLVHCTR